VAALATLGPGFEFVTRVVARGSVADGTLGGDLCLIGGGDPNLSGRFHDGDVTALFRAWAARLVSLGIRRVAGDIQYESSLFGGEAYCEGWPRDDQYTRWYCAEVSALAFNDNCVGVRVIPGKAGEPAKIETIPPTAYVTVINQTTTLPGRKAAEIGILRGRADNTITVKGRVYEQATWGYSVDVAVHQPEAYAATVFRETLMAHGIAVDGGVKPVTLSADQFAAARTLVEHRAKLVDALKPVNTNSQNLHAEMLLRQLGARFTGKGTFRTGTAALAEYLKNAGLPADGCALVDGSGLAASNRLTANLLAQLLRRAAAEPWYEDFRQSLAVGGESGTLEKRLNDTVLKGKVFAKTGYISNVRALSGYVLSGKRRFAFSILMNDCAYSRECQDEIIRLLARA
jgi:D-alanyl-D-alanine carboxypeptidase/D-alanyl-D-alanine-endopeptidase (penicillin-binding protein 4)